jgi:hypothetical protein
MHNKGEMDEESRSQGSKLNIIDRFIKKNNFIDHFIGHSIGKKFHVTV